MAVSPTEIRHAEEAGMWRHDKCVRFGYVRCAVPVGQFVYLYLSSGEGSGQGTQTEFTNVSVARNIMGVVQVRG